MFSFLAKKLIPLRVTIAKKNVASLKVNCSTVPVIYDTRATPCNAFDKRMSTAFKSKRFRWMMVRITTAPAPILNIQRH